MKFKKLLALLLAIVMITAFVAACTDDPAPPDPSPEDPVTTPEPPPPDDPVTPDEPAVVGGTFANVTTQTDVAPLGIEPTRENTLIVGYNVAALGDFTPGFSIGAYDQTIWRLIHGDVGTVNFWDPGGAIYINPTVVADYSIEDDALGNRTYTFQIHEGLLWSDGTAITAFDFVADVLWRASPQWLEAGAVQNANAYFEFIGWEAYNSGETEYFEAVRLIDDYTFSVTIDEEHLPYFFELVMVLIQPAPSHVWLPGVTITTNENGSKFDADISAQTLDVAANFRFAPTVVAGPYTFVSFENNIVTLARNPAFAGTSSGMFPQIDFIQQIEVSNETDVDQLFAGEVDLLPSVLTASKVDRVIANPDFTTHDYLRFGYGVVNFIHYGDGLASDPNMRWAVAHLLDRQAVLDQVLGGRGSLIDTEASPGQWMWQARGAEAVATMRPIALSIESANYFLDQTDFVFEADGETPWDPEQANARGTYLRHNSDGEPLVWRNGGAAPDVSEAIHIETVSNAAMAGMEFSSEFVDWVAVVGPFMNEPWTIPEEERIFHSFSMGWGFSAIFDPYLNGLHTDWIDSPSFVGWSDPVLDEIVLRMRRTDGADLQGFLDAWFDYVIRFNEVLPALPLYNNVWADLHHPRIQGMGVLGDIYDWARGITHLSLS